MSHVDFILPRNLGWDPENFKGVFRVARRIAEIRFGSQRGESFPKIGQKNAIVLHPVTNAHWLYPPGTHPQAPRGHWRLTASRDSAEKLRAILMVMLHFSGSI